MGGPRKTMYADGWKGGNTTFGVHRRGYRGGRKPKYPKGTIRWRPIITLSDQEYALALLLGEGNASEGVRRALSHMGKLVPCPDGMDNRFAMEAYTEDHRVAVRALIAPVLGLPAKLPTRGGQSLNARLSLASSLNIIRKEALENIADMEPLEPPPAPEADWDDLK